MLTKIFPGFHGYIIHIEHCTQTVFGAHFEPNTDEITRSDIIFLLNFYLIEVLL